MPLVETVTILNKSGKVVSTGKHLVNIFKDAKDAYNDKKAELRAEHRARVKHRDTQRLIQARDETRSNASSRHSHRSKRSHRHRDEDGPSRPPLTTRNLSYATEGSVTSSRRSRSHHGTRRQMSPDQYRPPQIETELSHTSPGLPRRHTEFPARPTDSALTRGTLPPNYSELSRIPPKHVQRSHSHPDLGSEHIDMNLAYGRLPPDLQDPEAEAIEREHELKATMTKLDSMLMEAHCLQHTATAIIANLQANPEAMAAVALTLAELSTLLTKMSPGILTALKASSPAVFALLASPQFLIAGGVALGVTVVMFGGYKIIKKIQADNTAKRTEANRMDEAMAYDGIEMGSIDSWRRGIADVEQRSVATSVDGEFITPEAARQKKERIRERRREERSERGSVSGSVHSERSERTVRRVGSESTIRKRSATVHGAPSETGRSERSSASKTRGKEEGKEKKKKTSALSVIFKKNKDKGKDKASDIRSSTLSIRPKIVDL